ncbi:MAG TPA: hypothetical protein VKQ72_22770 [Aggregatilineales bacterium]|nr:hypothetical protein [Aggregatilineales bacterium]
MRTEQGAGAVFLTYVAPNPVGGGGYHRSYQVHYELLNIFGADNVKVLNPKEVLRSSRHGVALAPNKRPSRIINLLKARLRRFQAARENPFRLFVDTEFSLRRFSHPKFLYHYENYVKSKERPDLCIVDHAGFYGVLQINRKYGIPTIACTQNLDSLVANPDDSRWFLPAISHNFANEINFYKSCDARLFMSKVETAVINGLGYRAAP